MLHGAHHSKALAEQLCAAYGFNFSACSRHVQDAAIGPVNELVSDPIMLDISTIVAVGGGSIQDVAKLVAARAHRRLIILPSVVATDGIASPVAVIKGGDGRTRSHAAKAPEQIFLCPELLADVPLKYWRALAGDILGNVVAVRDARKFDQAPPHSAERTRLEQGCELAEQAAASILSFKQPNLACSKFRLELLKAAIISSRAMLRAGSSRPCSGAEHLISHAIDHHLGPDIWPHGLQVAACVPAGLALHDERDLADQITALYRVLQMPPSLPNLGIRDNQTLRDIIRLAPSMRPGRSTILDHVEDCEVLACHQEVP